MDTSTLTPETNSELRQIMEQPAPPAPRIVEVYPTAIVISLTDAAGLALYRQWEQWNGQARPGCRRWTLQAFIAWRIEEMALGPGVDDGAAEDWLARR